MCADRYEFAAAQGGTAKSDGDCEREKVVRYMACPILRPTVRPCQRHFYIGKQGVPGGFLDHYGKRKYPMRVQCSKCHRSRKAPARRRQAMAMIQGPGKEALLERSTQNEHHHSCTRSGLPGLPTLALRRGLRSVHRPNIGGRRGSGGATTLHRRHTGHYSLYRKRGTAAPPQVLSQRNHAGCADTRCAAPYCLRDER